MAGAKCHQVPLGVQRHSGDRGGGHALHQQLGLEARGEGARAGTGVQTPVALPGEALPVLEQVHHGHLDLVVRPLVTQGQDQHLQANRSDGRRRGQEETKKGKR